MNNLKIDEILRYALAGGIAMLAVWLGYREPTQWLNEKREGALISLVFAVLPILLGALSYVLHRALIYHLLYRVLAKLCGRTGSKLELDMARWKNQAKSGSLQSRLGEWAAQIHFLYAATWAVAMANVVAHIGQWTQSRWHWLELSFLPLLLIAAVVHHRRYLIWEAEIFRHDAALPSEANHSL
jgi:uncharacterized membrane protein YhdT